MRIRTIHVGETDPTKRQVWFDLRLASDGITPVLTEDGGQPQISVAGSPWTNVGIGTLVGIGNGRYYAVLTQAAVSAFGVSIESRYQSDLTAETPGDTARVEEYDLTDVINKLELTGGSLEGGSGGGVSANYYGNLQEAANYFDNRLHERAWTQAKVSDRPKALLSATLVIDTLNFKGFKAPVYTLLQENPKATQDEIRAAEDSQVLEFPRGADTTVPEAIRRACYEIAHSLLDGKDPELELETLGIVSQGYSSVRTTYSRTQLPIEHLINGIPNALAWRLLRPFLRDDDAIRLSRVS